MRCLLYTEHLGRIWTVYKGDSRHFTVWLVCTAALFCLRIGSCAIWKGTFLVVRRAQSYRLPAAFCRLHRSCRQDWGLAPELCSMIRCQFTSGSPWSASSPGQSYDTNQGVGWSFAPGATAKKLPSKKAQLEEVADLGMHHSNQPVFLSSPGIKRHPMIL